MCLLVYVGSERPLPEIPWDECKPAFHVQRSDDDEVAKLLSKPNKYYVGSSGKCGCEFYYEDSWDEECPDPELRETRRGQFGKLRQYVKEMAKSGEVELVAFWSEPKGDIVKNAISVNEFTMPVFSIPWNDMKTLHLTIDGK